MEKQKHQEIERYREKEKKIKREREREREREKEQRKWKSEALDFCNVLCAVKKGREEIWRERRETLLFFSHETAFSTR